jgi:hypothetical protein
LAHRSPGDKGSHRAVFFLDLHVFAECCSPLHLSVNGVWNCRSLLPFDIESAPQREAAEIGDLAENAQR